MNRIKLSAKALLLIGGIGIAATGLAGAALAAVQPSSAGSGPMTVVIRGSSETVAQPSSDERCCARGAARLATGSCTPACPRVCLPIRLRLCSGLWLCHVGLRCRPV